MFDLNDLIPHVKKTISSFINEEDGKITKTSLLSMGAVLAGLAAASALHSSQAKAEQLFAIRYEHVHSHASHSAHSNHSSY